MSLHVLTYSVVFIYSTSVTMDGKLIHIGYQKFKQELFVLILPANR